jgi:hypothetical protein
VTISPDSLATHDPYPGQSDFDQTVPNSARIYDWLLGGKDNYDADRQAARKLLRAVPGARQAARDNRAFLGRVTRFLAEAGVDQFIDIGSGLPAADPVHEVARAVNPDVRVVYVDHDPVVVAHARAILSDNSASSSPPRVTAVEADVRYPRNLLTTREICNLIDFSRPVAILLVAVLHFVPEASHPHDIVAAIAARVAPGSYLAISHVTGDHITADAARAAEVVYEGASAPGVPRRRGEIARFLRGLDVAPPGVVDIRSWRPGRGRGRQTGPCLFYGAVGQVPDHQ